MVDTVSGGAFAGSHRNSSSIKKDHHNQQQKQQHDDATSRNEYKSDESTEMKEVYTYNHNGGGGNNNSRDGVVNAEYDDYDEDPEGLKTGGFRRFFHSASLTQPPHVEHSRKSHLKAA